MNTRALSVAVMSALPEDPREAYDVLLASLAALAVAAEERGTTRLNFVAQVSSDLPLFIEAQKELGR